MKKLLAVLFSAMAIAIATPAFAGGGHGHRGGTFATIGKIAVVGAAGYGLYRLVSDAHAAPAPTQVTYIQQAAPTPPPCRVEVITGYDRRGYRHEIPVTECWDPQRGSWIRMPGWTG